MSLFKRAMILFIALATSSNLLSEEAGSESAQSEKMLLTIFLKHDQSKTPVEINSHLERTEFWEHFPPDVVKVVSWYVMMGIGQVVTLKLSPNQIREVNLLIEKKAWGVFQTEFYPTYDFQPIWKSKKTMPPTTKKP